MSKFDSFKLKQVYDFQQLWLFPNGWGASVITNGYGKNQGLLELAVIDSTFTIDYTTELLPNGIQGWLTEEQVQELLQQVYDLPPKGA